MAVADIDDVDSALAVATAGARVWRLTPAHERFAILLKAASLADERSEDIAQIISAENGKSLIEARGEASRSGEIIRLAAFEGTQLYGESLPLDANKGTGFEKIGFTLREPVGVVVAIAPFNYPALLVLHKIAPAIAAGNAVVLKPSRATPLTSIALAQCFRDAGLPDGVLNVVTGSGGVLGDALVSDARVRKVSFTGSTVTGEQITRVAGIKKLSLELGASGPVAVLRDADIDFAAEAVALGGYINAGQVCISVQRVILDEHIATDFIDALKSKVEKIKVGDPRADDTKVGTLISRVEVDRVSAAIRRAQEEGATLVTGGEQNGTLIQPAILANVDRRSSIAQDELFGPAVAISTARDTNHAIELANSTIYGLGAGIFTKDVSSAIQAARQIESGVVHINWTQLWRADLMLYGGYKSSGIGQRGRSLRCCRNDRSQNGHPARSCLEPGLGKNHDKPQLRGEAVRLTVAQAVVRYIAAQYSVSDGVRRRFIPAAMGLFGHGNVAGLGQALDQYSDILPFVQGRNEQALTHAAIAFAFAFAFAKASKRKQALVVTASVGPGALNVVTAAALATVNRLPVLLLPGDTYATRRQGPVLQQIEHPHSPDVTVNDAFRPVSKFFDRITRAEQLLTALPQAFRVLANPVETGAVVISLPQDVQSHAFDFPVSFFAEKDWKIRRPEPSADDVDDVAVIKAAKKPFLIAGGGIIYSEATEALQEFADATGIPVAGTFAGKGAVQIKADWHVCGIGLEGAPQTNRLAEKADVIIHVGTRLTDFATGSQSLFQNPDVRFVSINVAEFDGIKQGAKTVISDAKLGLNALTAAIEGYRIRANWSDDIRDKMSQWHVMRQAAIGTDSIFDKAALFGSEDTDAVITQGQLLGVLQKHMREGDTLIAGAGSPPGDIQKVWDATGGRTAHLEFGFSCMGYELPAAIGVRLADPNPAHRVVTFIGDGTFVMAPTELVTAAQEHLPLTIVVSENHGYQVIRRLQMWRAGNSFGNEFRYREEGPVVTESASAAGKAPRLEGNFLKLDIVQMALGMGCEAYRPETATEFADVLERTRTSGGPVVIVVPTIPHADLPSSDLWWDVAPAEVSEQSWVADIRADYEIGLATQRWHG